MSGIRSFSHAGFWFMAIMAIVGSAPASLAMDSGAPKVPTEYPLAIVCWNQQTEVWGLGYLANIGKAGTATYMGHGGSLHP